MSLNVVLQRNSNGNLSPGRFYCSITEYHFENGVKAFDFAPSLFAALPALLSPLTASLRVYLEIGAMIITD
jgi:hypothetical protein